MTTLRLVALGVAASMLLSVATASAGLLDSPPPAFPHAAGEVIYRMGPVYFDPGHVDTVIQCTNRGHNVVAAALEVFDEQDRLAAPAVETRVAPGATCTFATSGDVTNMPATVVSKLPAIRHGKARVSATDSQLSCTGTHIVREADGRTAQGPLALVKRVARDAATMR